MTDNAELIADIFSLQRVNGNEDAYIFTEDEQVKSIFGKEKDVSLYLKMLVKR